jgi:DNA-binding IscR family transcriptional regulator
VPLWLNFFVFSAGLQSYDDRTVPLKAGMTIRIPAKVIHQAVEAPKAFAIHAYTSQRACPVSCNIKKALDTALTETQKAMEESLDDISLAEIIADIKK